MTTIATANAPASLSDAGRVLWDDIIAQADADHLDLDARELRWLRDACAEADQLARIEDALLTEPMVVVGHTGQPRPNGLLGEARASRSVIAALLAKLGISDTVVNGSGSRTTSESARRAANSRWHGDPSGRS